MYSRTGVPLGFSACPIVYIGIPSLETLRFRSRTSFSIPVIYTIDGDRVAAPLFQYLEDALT